MTIGLLTQALVATVAVVPRSAAESDLVEQFLRHRDLGHLEDDVAAMAHDHGADLHELLPQAGQRPLLDRLWQRQRPHEVGEIVGQRMKQKTRSVGGERAA